MTDLSARAARRIALAAQGFCDPRPSGRVDIRRLRRVIRRVAAVQIDSVNVLVRSHYLPFFSRLGPYPMHLVDDLAYRRRELFEYWGHVASLMPVELFPALRHRMEAATPRARVRRVMAEHAGYVDAVFRQVQERGPLAASGLDDPGARTGPWWGYGKGKIALEWHFTKGWLAVAGRVNFARVYDLTERVIPAAVLQRPALARRDAQRELLRAAAAALGVGTAGDLADYFRIRLPEARPRLAELVEQGDLELVSVEGWTGPAYLHRNARAPRRVAARALLSPFDSLIWERSRTERLFGFRYRIEIYVPEGNRRYGYYVLPFLLGESLCARVDLKADRQQKTLRVLAAHVEPGADVARVAGQLRDELADMARWLGLPDVEVRARGNLAGALRAAMR